MPLYWLEQTAADVPAGDAWLGEQEMATLALLKFPKRRADWRLGRWTAKHAIAAHLAAAIHDIEVRAAPSGAPRAFISGVPANLTLSLSHSHGVACCAVADGSAALGCDIEKIEPRNAAFLNEFFTVDERAAVASWPKSLHDTAVTVLWCAKESVLKALEIGLRGDPLSVNVELGGACRDGWMLLRAGVADGWWRAQNGFARAVVECPTSR